MLYMMSARLRYVNGSAVTAAGPLHGNSVLTYIHLRLQSNTIVYYTCCIHSNYRLHGEWDSHDLYHLHGMALRGQPIAATLVHVNVCLIQYAYFG